MENCKSVERDVMVNSRLGTESLRNSVYMHAFLIWLFVCLFLGQHGRRRFFYRKKVGIAVASKLLQLHEIPRL